MAFKNALRCRGLKPKISIFGPDLEIKGGNGRSRPVLRRRSGVSSKSTSSSSPPADGASYSLAISELGSFQFSSLLGTA